MNTKLFNAANKIETLFYQQGQTTFYKCIKDSKIEIEINIDLDHSVVEKLVQKITIPGKVNFEIVYSDCLKIVIY